MTGPTMTGDTWLGRGALALLAMVLIGGGCLLPQDQTGDDDTRPGGGGDDDTGDDDTGDDDDMTPPDDDDTGDDDTGDDDTGDDDDFTSGGDEDHDGYTTEEGDCDDHNPAIYPGADDICDAFDNDCDGRLNEDSLGYDMFEPNDQNGHDLGDLSGASDTIDSFIHEPDDEDHFLFYLVDDADHNYVGLVGSADDGGPGDAEYLDYDGSYWGDDSGTYEVVVYSESGFDCDDAYILTISGGG